MQKLRLRGSDETDLEIIASAVQDSIAKIGQLIYDASEHAVTLRLSRFMHEQDNGQGNKRRGQAFRIEAGLRFDGVLNLRSQGLSRDTPEAMIVILGLRFVSTEAPAGHIDIELAGGGVLRLDVEAIDVTLADIGEPRPTRHRPFHEGQSLHE